MALEEHFAHVDGHVEEEEGNSDDAEGLLQVKTNPLVPEALVEEMETEGGVERPVPLDGAFGGLEGLEEAEKERDLADELLEDPEVAADVADALDEDVEEACPEAALPLHLLLDLVPWEVVGVCLEEAGMEEEISMAKRREKLTKLRL